MVSKINKVYKYSEFINTNREDNTAKDLRKEKQN